MAILLTGSGLLSVLLPVRGSLERFSTLEIALISSSFFTGFGGGCLFGSRLVRAVGHIRTFTAMTALAAAVALAHPFVVVPPIWWLLRSITGFCFAVLYMVIESWLSARSTRENRGVVLSAYMVINLTVVTIGQMMLPLHDPRGMELFAIAAILISLAAVPVSLDRSPAPEPIAETRIRIAKLYRVSPLGVGAALAVGLSNGPFWALGPSFARSNGFDEVGIAMFMSATVLGGALGQWPLGRLSDRIDRRTVMIGAAVCAGLAGSMLLSGSSRSGAALLGAAALWGAFAFPIHTLGVAHANDHAAPEDFVETAAGLLLVYAAGAVAGPFVASAVTGALGIQALYVYMAGVHGVLIAFALWRTTQTAAPPEEDQVTFADALHAARTISPVFDEQTQSELELAQEGSPEAAAEREEAGLGP